MNNWKRPITPSEGDMLRIYFNALDPARQNELIDYSEQLLDEQRKESVVRLRPVGRVRPTG